jgi:hypothetical protein
MDLSVRRDLITQAELRKGAELMAGISSATRLVCAIYVNALARRIAGGAAIEPGPLAFDPNSKSVYNPKTAGVGSASFRAYEGAQGTELSGHYPTIQLLGRFLGVHPCTADPRRHRVERWRCEDSAPESIVLRGPIDRGHQGFPTWRAEAGRLATM